MIGFQCERDSIQETTLLEERQNTATFCQIKSSIQDLIEQKMLDEHLPTWLAKRSNNVGSSKVGAVNPTLFDSLASALF